MNKWEVETSVLGEVTGDGRLIIDWQGERIVDVDPSTVAVDGPVYDRPVAYPTWIDALQADAAENLPRANDPETLREQFLALVASRTSRTRAGSRTSTTTTCSATRP